MTVAKDDAVRRPGLMPLAQALSTLLGKAGPLPGRETVATLEADGRVLAQDLVSALDVPAHDNSAMDGYAVRCADVAAALAAGQALSVSQRIAAGHAGPALAPASVARIFTGAPVPAGADAVIMQEEGEAASDEQGRSSVRFALAPQPGQWIRRQGEDVRKGATVLPAGTRLGPAELGLAASMGFASLEVRPRVRVALFSTGDELVMPGEIPPERMAPGAIYNSNRFFLRALLQRLGCEVSDLGIVPDRREATVAALRSAAESHDLILTSGGVSVGEEDHIKPAVQQLGGLDLWQIAIKPGKPFAHGWIARANGASCHFIGLPGNPVSSFVTFLLLVRPFLLRLQGVEVGDGLPQSIPMRADFAIAKADRRREFLRVRRNDQGGLDLFANQSSGVLTSVVWGDGLVDLAAGSTVARGDTVPFIPLEALLA
ncbi:MAG: hypothetical protein RJA36_205 [Pseudomonadota bacterium]|jgi:molybdopterin molybdotransferase